MMIKPLIAAALALGSIAVAPAVNAQRYGYGYADPRYEQSYRQEYWQASRGGDDRRYGDDRRGYDRRDEPRRYEGRDARRCNNGTTGAILGALAGGLLGHSIGGRGDRAVGTIVGAGGGALAGRAVERSGNQGYCR